MEAGVQRAAAGFYLEREDAPEPFFDRMLGTIGFRWHHAFARQLEHSAALAADVTRHAGQLEGKPLPPRLSELRYRLRRDGMQAAHVAECLGLYCAALSRAGSGTPDPDALAAATVILNGGVVELSTPVARRDALGLAAATWAIYGVPVHVLTGSEGGARTMAEMLRAPLAALGFDQGLIVQGMESAARREAYAAAVVCGQVREVAHDYLRDRLLLGGRPRPLAGMLQRLSAGAAGERRPLMRGLHCALVEDADAVMLEDAHLPLAIAVESEQPQERLMYEQAIELARSLSHDTDFALEEGGARLTVAGAERIERLVGPLGGIWGARQRREELIADALEVIHRLKRDVDYQVKNNRVVLPEPERDEMAEATADNQTIQRLIEVKEGCKLGTRPEVLARLSLPRFLRRYLRLAGACADARGAESEYWSLYSLKTTSIGTPPASVSCSARVFSTTATRRTALVDRVRALGAAGHAVVVAVRTHAEGHALMQELAVAGIGPGILQGASNEADLQVLDQLNEPGAVLLILHPAERNVVRTAGRVPLHVVVAELHHARRQIDRICRAFAADTCEIMLALEDEGVAAQLGSLVTTLARSGVGEGGECPAGRSRWLTFYAQSGIERACVLMRQDLIARDRQLDDLLAFSGRRE